MTNAWLDEAQVEIMVPERNINNLRYADNTTLMAESEEELKSLLMKVNKEIHILKFLFIKSVLLLLSHFSCV